MTELLEKLVIGFGQNPMLARKTMHRLLEANRDLFRKAALPVLQTASEGQGHHFLTGLLLTGEEALDWLGDPASATLDEAIALAKRASRVDPLIEVKLARRLTGTGEGVRRTLPGSNATRIMEILAAISDGTRIVTLLSQLVRNPDPKIRSKAALLFGRTFRDSRWSIQQLAETDARVRANAIEALWGMGGDASIALFKSAVADPNNRVAANAILGLYRAQQTASVPLLLEMAAHSAPEFRVSAAWVMGETRDPRFLPALDAALNSKGARPESGSLLGPVARRARTAIQDAGQLAVQAGALTLSLSCPAEAKAEPERKVSVFVTAPDGSELAGLSPLSFIVREGDSLVSRFSVTEQRQSDPLVVGFAFPNAPERNGAIAEALGACVRHKKKLDLWAAVAYREGAAQALTQSECAFTAETAAAIRMFAQPSPAASTPELAGAVGALISGSLARRGAKNVILLLPYAGVETGAAECELIEKNATAGKVTIHAIAPPDTPMASFFRVQEMCTCSGGLFLPQARVEDLPALLARIYVSMLDRYEIRFESSAPGAPLELQVYCSKGYGSVSTAVN